MKNIAIIVQPNRFDDLRKKLIGLGVCGMTVTNVEGFGFEKKQLKVHKDDDMIIELAPKIKIEIVLKDDETEKVVQAAMEEVRTGRLGDGKIFITELADAIRIRTGERGEHAL